MNFAIIVSFLKKSAYAAIGSLLAALSLGIAQYQPTGTAFDLEIYGALAAGFTGLVAAIKRWIDVNLANAKTADKK